MSSEDEWLDILHFYYTTDVAEIIMGVFTLIFGTLMNGWFFGAIVTSPELRGKLRNKLLLSLILVFLVDSILLAPLEIAFYHSLLSYVWSCPILLVSNSITFINDFVNNWLLVILLSVLLAHLLDYDPSLSHTPTSISVGSIVLCALPWVLAVILIPALILLGHASRSSAEKMWVLCFLDNEQITTFKFIDTATPMCLSIVMVTVAAMLRRRRLAGCVQSSSEVRPGQFGQSGNVELVYPYAVAVLVSTLNDIFIMADIVGLNDSDDYIANYKYTMVASAVQNARVFLMPLPWLLLPEVRERIKSWRPWYRPGAGIDLTAAYSKEDQ